METRRGLLVLGLPLVAVSALVFVAVAARNPERAVLPVPQSPAQVHSTPLLPASLPSSILSGKEPPKPAPVSQAKAAIDKAQLRNAYQNYRTAIATGNEPVRKALAKVLFRDLGAARQLAQEDIDRARTTRDREVALMAKESLER
jgi:hypothetical protein